MGTRVEVFSLENEAWMEMNGVSPGKHGAVLQNLPDGERLVYSVYCQDDDSRTVIAKVDLGLLDHPQEVLVNPNTKFKIVAVLRSDDDPYKLTFKPDGAERRRIARFTHVPEGGIHE